MPIEVLLVQLLVLVFTGALWWIARRDLAARVPPPAPPALPSQTADMAELEQICATLETLVTSHARRLDVVEAAQKKVVLTVPGEAAQRKAAQAQSTDFSPPAAMPEPQTPVPQTPKPVLEEPAAEPEPDPRYPQVYALLDRGISDPIEIARQTGLGRGEVDLILSLRGRRSL